MDCIEGMHCGVGYPNPDGQPTLCLEAPGRESRALLKEDYDDDEWGDYWEPPTNSELFDLLEGP
jgi:hypothetical protein